MEADNTSPVTTPRGRGRPKGSKNKPPPKPVVQPLLPRGGVAMADYRHADPAAIISRQIAMLDMAQQMVRRDMQVIFEDEHAELFDKDVAKLEKLSNGILRIIDALKKHGDLAEEMARRMSPEQLFEAAIKKIEGQDIATLNNVIKRLRQHRATLAPVSGSELLQLGESTLNDKSAAATIADLESE